MSNEKTGPRTLCTGEKVRIGWNGSKRFDDAWPGQETRVEAWGVDWVVLRDDAGKAHAATFPDADGPEDVRRMLER